MEYEFATIRHALEEHLSSINENTSEIQALFEFLQEMELKVEKLNARIEELQLHHQHHEEVKIAPLNHIERSVFLALYTEETPLAYEELAMKSELPLPIIQDCISSLINKGIPFQRTYLNNKLFLKLKPDFKERQAKENLINLSLNSFM
ncbi:hypothetical protein COV12_03550 [Candidatus Woesearchaeota archaeon CG10_big_fil_rev_8_21_14_0_10_32_24]|nr:MAG: hypothetical protein COV12_03550 [Candidatus Woesearchaeota archaeon CG10_big_fil_rev_8_21_14_0_10_32_24]